MKIDLTMPLSAALMKQAKQGDKDVFGGHMGTHFDVMGGEFPLAYTECMGIVFDVRSVRGREVGIDDVDLSRIKADMFVAFYTGWLWEREYGTKEYFSAHSELSWELIDALCGLKVTIIGIDSAGVRRAKEHAIADKKCASNNTFVVENLCHLSELPTTGENFTVYTFPVRWEGMTGLPCRVIAEVDE